MVEWEVRWGGMGVLGLLGSENVDGDEILRGLERERTR